MDETAILFRISRFGNGGNSPRIGVPNSPPTARGASRFVLVFSGISVYSQKARLWLETLVILGYVASHAAVAQG